MARGRPPKKTIQDSNDGGETVSVPVMQGETADGKQSGTVDLKSSDPIEQIKQIAGPECSYMQVEVRRLGDPPKGGYIGRLQFTSTASLDELPETLASQWGGGVYSIQLLKARQAGAMRYSSRRFEIAIGGPSLPITRAGDHVQTEQNVFPENLTHRAGRAASFSGVGVNPSAGVPAVSQPVQYQAHMVPQAPAQPVGFSFDQVLDFAKSVQKSGGLDIGAVVKLVGMMNGQAPAQMGQADPMSQFERMMGLFEMFRKFDQKSESKSEKKDEEDDEMDGSDMFSEKGLNKIITLAAIKMLGGGGLGGMLGGGKPLQGPSEKAPNPAPQAPKVSAESVTIPKPPSSGANWAFVPNKGWVELEPDEADIPETAADFEQKDPSAMADYIKTLPENERQEYITKLSADLFGLDESTIKEFVSDQAEQALTNGPKVV